MVVFAQEMAKLAEIGVTHMLSMITDDEFRVSFSFFPTLDRASCLQVFVGCCFLSSLTVDSCFLCLVVAPTGDISGQEPLSRSRHRFWCAAAYHIVTPSNQKLTVGVCVCTGIGLLSVNFLPENLKVRPPIHILASPLHSAFWCLTALFAWRLACI